MLDFSLADFTTRIEPHAARGGISIYLPSDETLISPSWMLGGFEIRFAHLAAGDKAKLNPASTPTYLKVVTGEIDRTPFRAFPVAGEVTTTQVDHSEITARQDSVLCIVREIEAVPSITAMTEIKVSGPMSETMEWQSFDEKFGAFTDTFRGLDAHMVPGFHLLDSAGAEIAYVHFWTTGKGVDVSTHNHGQDPSDLAPAFAEVHLVLKNGTKTGGMYLCDAPGATERERMPIQAGEEHGPFFLVDATTGLPRMRPNGAVEYPWHGWQGGVNDDPSPSYDLVAAFEINPVYAKVE